MIDLIALAAVALVAARGWSRGTRAMALWGLSLVVGSVAAALLARPVGNLAASTFSMSALLAYPLGGAVVAGVATAVVRSLLRRTERARRARIGDGWSPSTQDRVGGAVLGTGVGVALVLFVGWVAASLGALSGHREEMAGSFVGRTSGRIAEPVVRVLAGRATGDVVVAASMAYVVSDPQEARETAATLLSDARLRTLAADAKVRAALASGDSLGLAASPLLAALAGDQSFVRAARRVRLLDAGDGPASAAELAGAASRHLGPLVRAADELRQDPNVRRILERSDVGAALERGDLAKVLTDPGFTELLNRIGAKLREAR